MSGAQFHQTVQQWQFQQLCADGDDAQALQLRHHTNQNPETIMPKITDMLPSNYLKQADFPEDYIVTIRKIAQANIAMDGKPADLKWLAHFDEFEKPMVLNSTNIQLMAKACDSDDTDNWTGIQIIVYVDPNVSFGGELVGGLRIRKHKQQVAPTAPKRPAMAGTGPGADDRGNYAPE